MMDLRFTEEQELLRKLVVDFAQREIKPFVPRMEAGEFPKEILKKMASLGLMGITGSRKIWGSRDGLYLLYHCDS